MSQAYRIQSLIQVGCTEQLARAVSQHNSDPLMNNPPRLWQLVLSFPKVMHVAWHKTYPHFQRLRSEIGQLKIRKHLLIMLASSLAFDGEMNATQFW
jgi:hypothetical protein